MPRAARSIRSASAARSAASSGRCWSSRSASITSLPLLRWDRGPNAPDQAVLIDLAEPPLLLLLHRDLAAGILLPHRPADHRRAGAVPDERGRRPRLVRLSLPADGLDRPVPCRSSAWSRATGASSMQRDAAPWTAEQASRAQALKHFLWLMVAWWTGGAWVLYFADAPTLVQRSRDLAGAARRLSLDRHPDRHDLRARRPHARAGLHLHVPVAAHPGGADRRARAQRHLPLRPRRAARLGEEERGAARARACRPATASTACNACMSARPASTSATARNLDCIQCGLCIDACDDVMAKIGRPTRLIAYDTDLNIKRRAGRRARRSTRFVRMRTVLYAAIIAAVGGVMIFTLATRTRAGDQRDPRPQPGLRAAVRRRDPQRLHGAHRSTRRCERREFALSDRRASPASLLEVVAARATGRPVRRRGRPRPDARVARARHRYADMPPRPRRRSRSISTIVSTGERAPRVDHFRAPAGG